ncbi:MAG: surface lipoprotein assembly modifier [Burkholderiales bacterium]
MLIVLSLGARAQSDDLRSANELIKQGKPAEALAQLRAVADKDGNVTNPEYHYLVGIAANDSGDIDGAIESLREAVRLKPDFLQAHAELARAYMSFGNLFLANREMDKVKEGNPPPEVAAALDKYVDDYHKAVLAGRKRLTGNVSIGFGHDSNVNSATAAQSIFLPILGGIRATLDANGRARSDSFTLLAGDVGGFYPLSERFELIGGAIGSAKINSDIDQFDSIYFNTSGGLRVNVDEKSQFNVVANLDSVRLDNKRVRDSTGVTAQWATMVHPLIEAGAFVQQARLAYPQESFRDADRLVYGMSLTPGAFGRRLISTPPMLVLYGGKEDPHLSDVPQLGNDFWGIRLGDVHYFSTRLASFQGLSYERRNYGGPDPLFLETRRDEQWDLTLGLLYKWTPQWTIVPLVSYTNNRSNLEVFKFDRTAVSVSLRYSFQ